MLRRVLLLKRHSCPVCNKDFIKAIISANLKDTYENFIENQEFKIIEFCFILDTELLPDVRYFYEICCPNCNKTYENFDILLSHITIDHDQLFCKLCLQYKRIFLYEQKLFDLTSLRIFHFQNAENRKTLYRKTYDLQYL